MFMCTDDFKGEKKKKKGPKEVEESEDQGNCSSEYVPDLLLACLPSKTGERLHGNELSCNKLHDSFTTSNKQKIHYLRRNSCCKPFTEQ